MVSMCVYITDHLKTLLHEKNINLETVDSKTPGICAR